MRPPPRTRTRAHTMPIARLRDLESWIDSFQQNPPRAVMVLLVFVGLLVLYFWIRSLFSRRK